MNNQDDFHTGIPLPSGYLKDKNGWDMERILVIYT